jgi:hypothetical protein
LLVWSLAAPFAVMMSGAAQQADAIDPPPPTPIERALVERGCSTPAMLAAEPDVRQRCADAQLGLLRDDFGINLKRLSTAERKTVDAACRRLETTHGRDGYLDCVNAQLVGLRVQRGAVTGAHSSSPDAAADRDGSNQTTAAAQDALAPLPAPPQPTAARRTTIVGGVLLAIAAVAGGSLVLIKKRGPRLVCRECGAATTQLGDLCPACRHAAADALRRAAAERMEQIRADDAERRRRLQAEEEQRRQQALREEDERARVLEEAQCREENARRAREEEARRELRREAAVQQQRSAEDVFDPYAVLGVRRDITSDDLRAAYEQARLKYDENSVAHLSDEVQQHFREKALAVDRAYQMLAG